MLKGDKVSDRISRWQMRFSSHFCDFVHVPGKELAVVDGLSRLRNALEHIKKTDDDELIALASTADPLWEVGRLNSLMEDDWYTAVIDVRRHAEKFTDGDPSTLRRRAMKLWSGERPDTS
jgi:hypothetical protein